MSESQLEDLWERTENLLSLQRAPSQFQVFYHLLESGKTMTVSEVAEELVLTSKATERAMAKLLDKGLVQRSIFRAGSYTCDTRQILLSLLMMVMELYDDYKERK